MDNSTYEKVRWLGSKLLDLFFTEVEVVGVGNVPVKGGGLVVAWHPNGIIDPALILSCLPREVVFGARDGLFRWPLLGRLMRAIDTVPIYRAEDGGDDNQRKEANTKSLSALADAMLRGKFAVLFPEGVSHDRSFVQPIRRGAARLYFTACDRSDDADLPSIIPVGLHYNQKRGFRSKVLVVFYPPLDVVGINHSFDDRSLGTEQLTERIEATIHEVIGATEDWETHHLMHRARRIVRSESRLDEEQSRDLSPLHERAVGFARIHKGYAERLRTDPQRIGELYVRLRDYNDDIRALGFHERELGAGEITVSPWIPVILVVQGVMIYLLLPPILMIGYAVNSVPALLLRAVCIWGAKDKKDEATIKLLGGVVLFPIFWIAAGVVTAMAHPWVAKLFPNIPATPLFAGVSVAILAAVGGAVAVRYLRLSKRLVRQVRVGFTRHRASESVYRLLAERRAIYEELISLREGLELPEQLG